MAVFYGTLQGAGKAKTSTGNYASGIKATAQSWNGSVSVTVRKERPEDGNWPHARDIVAFHTENGSVAEPLDELGQFRLEDVVRAARIELVMPDGSRIGGVDWPRH